MVWFSEAWSVLILILGVLLAVLVYWVLSFSIIGLVLVFIVCLSCVGLCVMSSVVWLGTGLAGVTVGLVGVIVVDVVGVCVAVTGLACVLAVSVCGGIARGVVIVMLVCTFGVIVKSTGECVAGVSCFCVSLVGLGVPCSCGRVGTGLVSGAGAVGWVVGVLAGVVGADEGGVGSSFSLISWVGCVPFMGSLCVFVFVREGRGVDDSVRCWFG
jgi:hypothetical protein